MADILNCKKGATIIKLNTTVINLNVWGILMSHCGRDTNMENIPLDWLTQSKALEVFTVVIWVVTKKYVEKPLFFRALIFQSVNYVENASHNSFRSLRDILHGTGILFKCL
jgi:hypothetical protein